MTPQCRFCVHWRRRSGVRGQCWSSHQAIVPTFVKEHDACDRFVDQLANRAADPPISGPQADGDDGSTAA